jgi:hypothetical protein
VHCISQSCCFIFFRSDQFPRKIFSLSIRERKCDTSEEVCISMHPVIKKLIYVPNMYGDMRNTATLFRNQSILTASRHVEVKEEAVFTLVGEQGYEPLQVVVPASRHDEQRRGAVRDVRIPLRTHSSERIGQASSRPDHGWCWRPVPQVSNRRRGVRHTSKRLNRLKMSRIQFQNYASDRTSLGFHDSWTVSWSSLRYSGQECECNQKWDGSYSRGCCSECFGETSREPHGPAMWPTTLPSPHMQWLLYYGGYHQSSAVRERQSRSAPLDRSLETHSHLTQIEAEWQHDQNW